MMGFYVVGQLIGVALFGFSLWVAWVLLRRWSSRLPRPLVLIRRLRGRRG